MLTRLQIERQYARLRVVIQEIPMEIEAVYASVDDNGKQNGTVVVRDGALLVQLDNGPRLHVKEFVDPLLDAHAKYHAWREEQGGTPGAPLPEVISEFEQVRILTKRLRLFIHNDKGDDAADVELAAIDHEIARLGLEQELE